MKKATSKKMTIDNLAVMVAKGFDGIYKKFDEVDKKFDEVDSRFDEVKKEISEVKKDIVEVKENLMSTRRDVLAMGDKFTLKYEFHDLASRVSSLEQKRKVKR
jgi:peptidoglycan hydrolase CwlO-like protein